MDIDNVHLFSSQKEYTKGGLNSFRTIIRQVMDEFLQMRFWFICKIVTCFQDVGLRCWNGIKQEDEQGGGGKLPGFGERLWISDVELS